MAERGEGHAFALEAGHTLRVVLHRVRKGLDRDLAPEPRVARAIHQAHAAFADQGRHV